MYGVRFSHRLSKNSASGIFLAGLVISALIGLAGYQQTAWITRGDHLFLDTLLKSTASNKLAQNTVVVDIDDTSLSAIGQWPWPRYRMAALIQAIAAKKPAAIGIDVLFSEPDRSSLVNVRQAFKRDFGVDITFNGAPAGLTDNDGYLGSVLAQTGAVAANHFYFDHASGPEVPGATALRFGGRTGALALNNASGVLSNTQAISSQTKFSGFINNQLDDDGILRKVPLLIRHNGVVHANLALATVMRALRTDFGAVEWDRHGPIIKVGNHRIPIDEKGFALLRFNGEPMLYPALSALEVLNGSLRDADIQGKTVFVGSSAAGLNDLHSTAFDPLFPGLKLQAVVAEGIASNQFVREPTWARKSIFAECLITGALMATLFIAASGALPMLLGSAVLAGILLLSGVLPFSHAGIVISPCAPLLVVGSLFMLFSVARFAIEKRHAFVWFKKLENARQVTMESMAAVAETRDPETGAHIKRTQHYVKAIAEELRRSGQYANVLTQETVDLLFISAPLHDIGKVGVPDQILLKPDKLTEDEFVLMKRHAEFGRSIISSTARVIEGDNFLILAGEIAATHHEKWDGTGYPLGLAGQDIPLSGRIMSVADVYDALISRRCYKEPFPHEKATDLMRAMRGTSFDPVVLDAFFTIEDTIKDIAAKYRDEREGSPQRGEREEIASSMTECPFPKLTPG